MKMWIFVEGTTDQSLLARLLEDLDPESPFEIVVAGGRNAARPLARQQLMTRHEPVVLVIDADTTDEEHARSQRNDLNDYLDWGAGSIPFKVVQFVPEIEVVFFHDPSVLRSLVGSDVDPRVAEAGAQAPRRILEILAPGRTRDELIAALGPDEIERLREHPIIADLRGFLMPPRQVSAGGMH